jgi:hypothetical protein
MSSYYIQKQFVVDAENLKQAEDIAGMIGFVVLDSKLVDVYMSDTISVKEVE